MKSLQIEKKQKLARIRFSAVSRAKLFAGFMTAFMSLVLFSGQSIANENCPSDVILSAQDQKKCLTTTLGDQRFLPTTSDLGTRPPPIFVAQPYQDEQTILLEELLQQNINFEPINIDPLDPNLRAEITEDGELIFVRVDSSSDDELSGTSSSDGLSGTAISGITISVLSVVGLVWWAGVEYGLWFAASNDDKGQDMIQFRTFGDDAYLPSRSWIGMEQKAMDHLKLAFGSFWMTDKTGRTLLPSVDNFGLDSRVLWDAGRGEVSFGVAALYGAHDDKSDLEDDDDIFRLQTHDQGDFGWDMRVGLRWHASF